ncbi:MAG: V-type ATPase 116kDa subunit family protein [Myxococcota bacterium]
MIVQMLRVRLAGPRALLDAVLAVVQDLGVLHLDHPKAPEAPRVDGSVRKEKRHLQRLVADLESALVELGEATNPPAPFIPGDWPETIRRARRIRRHAIRLHRARADLSDERVLLLRYREFFEAFESLVGHELTWPDGQAFYVVLRAGAGGAVAELKRSLESAVSGEVELLARELSSGEQAVLILVSPGAASKVAKLLSESRVEELPAPAGIGEKNLLRALPALKARLAAIPAELEAVDREREALRAKEGPWLEALRAWVRDRLLLLDARGKVLAGEHLFILEGWLPRPRFGELEGKVREAFGPQVVVEVVGEETWAAADAPVTLKNPPLFRPFEVVTRMLPLPKYGTIDPTPFVAVFFPAFFGLMLGDVGYGLMLAALAIVLRIKSKPDTTLRAVSQVGGACAATSIGFGFLFGELFGSLGHRLGLHPVFNREEAIIPFLGLSVALGGVHVLLGLVLAAVSAWRRGHKREAMGRGVAFTMVVLTALSLLAAFEVLPSALFTPFVVAVLVAFPVLIILEGLVALIELLSTFGHILSYARIMALGTASLMLAVVANQLVGAMGSVVVGVVFALLFHLVNFAIGVFSPTIHALRLHYVEFFGKFFSPGGAAYEPLGHWHRSPESS